MDPIELLKDFNSLGCDDEKKCAVAYRLFINLKEVCKYENIEKIYNDHFNEIYFNVSLEDKCEIYLPIASFDTIDLLKIEEFQKTICKEKSFILGICDPDSTVLYYKMTNKWVNKEANTISEEENATL